MTQSSRSSPVKPSSALRLGFRPRIEPFGLPIDVGRREQSEPALLVDDDGKPVVLEHRRAVVEFGGDRVTLGRELWHRHGLIASELQEVFLIALAQLDARIHDGHFFDERIGGRGIGRRHSVDARRSVGPRGRADRNGQVERDYEGRLAPSVAGTTASRCRSMSPSVSGGMSVGGRGSSFFAVFSSGTWPSRPAHAVS